MERHGGKGISQLDEQVVLLIVLHCGHLRMRRQARGAKLETGLGSTKIGLEILKRNGAAEINFKRCGKYRSHVRSIHQGIPQKYTTWVSEHTEVG